MVENVSFQSKKNKIRFGKHYSVLFSSAQDKVFFKNQNTRKKIVRVIETKKLKTSFSGRHRRCLPSLVNFDWMLNARKSTVLENLSDRLDA